MHGLKLELNRKLKLKRLTRSNECIHAHAHARTYTRTHVPLMAKIEWALSKKPDTYCPINWTNKLYTILDTACLIKWTLAWCPSLLFFTLLYAIKVGFFILFFTLFLPFWRADFFFNTLSKQKISKFFLPAEMPINKGIEGIFASVE